MFYGYLGAHNLDLPERASPLPLSPDVAEDPDQRDILTLMGRRPVQPEILAGHLGWEPERCLFC